MKEMQMPTPVTRDFKLPSSLELDRIISLQEAYKISSLSPDSWKRNHPDKIIELCPGRVGIRLRDALMFRSSTDQAPDKTEKL
jgi:hypothetical protein